MRCFCYQTMIRNILRFWQKTRRAARAKFQLPSIRSASAFWKSQGVYHEKYQPCPPGTVPLHRGGRNIHCQHSVYLAARAKHSCESATDGLPHTAAIRPKWRYKAMNRKNEKAALRVTSTQSSSERERIAMPFPLSILPQQKPEWRGKP